jgi:disulfide bond formation protein DsbB
MEAPRSSTYRLGGTALFLAIGTILTALAFEHLGGYAPCPLCLMQRWAYYGGIPLLFAAMALTTEKPRIASWIFLVVSLAFLVNAGLGVYHSGVEWKWWPGPDTCATQQALPTTAGDLLQDLDQRVVRCDEAAWRFLSLSFAGWNTAISLALMGLSLRASYAATESN